MLENIPHPEQAAAWGVAFEQARCPRCRRQYLLPAGGAQTTCPVCCASSLELLATTLEDPGVPLPESFLPFQVNSAGLARAIEQFASGLWFPPEDLNAANLMKRLRAVYLPVYLVDSQVQAAWQAEAGFNYQVVSHQERYDAGGWQTREVSETRLRWEPRLGRMARAYQNIAAPALDGHTALMTALGNYVYQSARPYAAAEAFSSAGQSWAVVLPDRAAEEAWSDALPVLQNAAAEDCRQAAAADQIRSFRWQPAFPQRNWTLMLLPMLTTYYLDDDKLPQPLMVNGQSARLNGRRRASPKRAQTAALWLALAAALCFVGSLVVGGLGLAFPPLLALAGFGIVAAMLLGAGAIAPLVIVWRVNKK